MNSFFNNRTDAALLSGSLNFSNLINATPTAYGLTAPLATAYLALHQTYSDAYYAAVDPITRTRGKVAAKNDAKAALVANARLLASIVQGTASVTNEQKIDLGLSVRAEPVPIPAPSEAPDIDIVSVTGRTVKIRLHNADTMSRAKPAGVKGAAVFSFVGAEPPTAAEGWKFEGNTTRTTVDVLFPADVAAGAKVWLTAFWFNPRAESGPGCPPVSTFLQFGGELPMAA